VALVVVVLAVLGAGAAFLLLGRDDGNESDAGAGRNGGSPEQITQSFVEAARTQDCETLLGLVSSDSFGGAGATPEQRLAACQQTVVVPYEFAVTGVQLVTQDGGTATVTVTADVPGGTDSETIDLVQENGGWKVDLGPGEASATVEGPPPIGSG
jgi:hypothetical protein